MNPGQNPVWFSLHYRITFARSYAVAAVFYEIFFRQSASEEDLFFPQKTRLQRVLKQLLFVIVRDEPI